MSLCRWRQGKAKPRKWSLLGAVLAVWEHYFLNNYVMYFEKRAQSMNNLYFHRRTLDTSAQWSPQLRNFYFMGSETKIRNEKVLAKQKAPGEAWWWRLAAGDLHSGHRQRADCSQSQRLLARSKSGGCLFFNSVLPPASSTWQTNPSKVSSMEKLSYYHLSMEEGEVNDNTIKLTRAVNSDLTPTVWTGKSYLQQNNCRKHILRAKMSYRKHFKLAQRNDELIICQVIFQVCLSTCTYLPRYGT